MQNKRKWLYKVGVLLLAMACSVLVHTTTFAQSSYDEPAVDSVQYEEKYTGEISEDSAAHDGWENRFDAIDTSSNAIFRQSSVDTAAWSKLLTDKEFWYANFKKQPKKEEEHSNNTGSSKSIFDTEGFKWFVWFFMGAVFIGIVIAFLLSSNTWLSQKAKKLNTPENVATEIPDDIFAIDFEAYLDKARLAGNYRFAIRLLFLRMLKVMAEKGIIEYSKDKTNMDYLMQIANPANRNALSKTALYYDYVWFGHFEVAKEQYQQIEQEITALTQTL